MIKRKRRNCTWGRPEVMSTTKSLKSHQSAMVEELHHNSTSDHEDGAVEINAKDKGTGSTSDHELRGDCGREKLQRHRRDVAGRVWIPDMWGQEELLKDWIDCAAFESSLVPSRILLARDALVKECRRVNSGSLRIENRC